ncbi:MAG: hypothetical protein AB8C95_10115 [Phycisphaeraceae bacterium]
MVRAGKSQSLNDFRDNCDQTLDRLSRTGDAEVLTQDGQARAVMLSPKAFDELNAAAEFANRLATIQQSEVQLNEGKGRPAEAFMDELRSKLLDKKAK